jgi:ABC transport system ATP-binding/permease protein
VKNTRAALEDPAIASDGPRLVVAHAEMEAAQKDLDTLYARWVELQEKADSLSSR